MQTARLTLVDLAGSERNKKTSSISGGAEVNLPPAVRQQQQRQQVEAMAINKSLAFLEQVVMALGKRGQSHVPHRSSRLTAVLRDALGGNSRTSNPDRNANPNPSLNPRSNPEPDPKPYILTLALTRQLPHDAGGEYLG